MWNKIVNPKTGRKVNLNTKIGKNILQNYLYFLQKGGASMPNMLENIWKYDIINGVATLIINLGNMILKIIGDKAVTFKQLLESGHSVNDIIENKLELKQNHIEYLLMLANKSIKDAELLQDEIREKENLIENNPDEYELSQKQEDEIREELKELSQKQEGGSYIIASASICLLLSVGVYLCKNPSKSSNIHSTENLDNLLIKSKNIKNKIDSEMKQLKNRELSKAEKKDISSYIEQLKKQLKNLTLNYEKELSNQLHEIYKNDGIEVLKHYMKFTTKTNEISRYFKLNEYTEKEMDEWLNEY